MEKEKPQNSGEIVERDEKGRFVPGHVKMGGKVEGSVSLTTMIKKKLMEMSPDQRRTALEVLAENIIQDALDGKDTPVKLIWNYVDGLPKGEKETLGDTNNTQINIIAGEEINQIAKEVVKKLISKEVDGGNK